jgi:hypothetical protein
LIAQVQQKGLIYKKVYVSINDCYFQNGIQLGSIWLDVANDTVNPKEPSI